MASDEAILGRPALNDVDAILAMPLPDPDEVEHIVADNAAATFTWNYQKGQRPKLDKLYEKAKVSQWNGSTDLDWSIDVDPERHLDEILSPLSLGGLMALKDDPSLPLHKFSQRDWRNLAYENFVWRLAQFTHGEQGALVCTAKIVETVPWIDAKYYAATQVVDEARHVEVFSRYLDEKLEGWYPINTNLRMLLDDIIADSRWDMTYLGMQIMVEGLALAAFGVMHEIIHEPLLKRLLRYVMSDEARHVAFGVLSLQEYYTELSAAEIRERQEFAYEAAVRMRDRFLMQEVWHRLGVDSEPILRRVLSADRSQDYFLQMLFSKIVPNCRKLGLLDAGDGWLRDRFIDMGVIHFENLVDTSDEYQSLDAFAVAGEGQ